MNHVTQQELANWKTVFARDGIKYDTDEEYLEAINNLVGYFELLIQIDTAQKHKVND